MSDPAPRRLISGLAPVAGIPSALDRMKGTGTPAASAPVAPTSVAAPAQPTQEGRSAPEIPSQAAERPPASASAPQSAQKAPTRPRSRAAAPLAPQRPAVAQVEAPKDQMTTYIARPTRERAKAAFKATQHLEGDESFSAFVQIAVERELARREKAYNDGKPYAGDGGRLTAGRPLQ